MTNIETDYVYPPTKIWSTERTLEVVKRAAREMAVEEVFEAILQSKGNVMLGKKEYYFDPFEKKQ